MTANERIEGLNARDPLHEWTPGQTVYCFHCDGEFPAEAVATDPDGDPCCPRCRATPLDFHPAPWWRE